MMGNKKNESGGKICLFFSLKEMRWCEEIKKYISETYTCDKCKKTFDNNSKLIYHHVNKICQKKPSFPGFFPIDFDPS